MSSVEDAPSIALERSMCANLNLCTFTVLYVHNVPTFVEFAAQEVDIL